MFTTYESRTFYDPKLSDFSIKFVNTKWLKFTESLRYTHKESLNFNPF